MLRQLISKFELVDREMDKAISQNHDIDLIRQIDKKLQKRVNAILEYSPKSVEDISLLIRFCTNLLERKSENVIYRSALESINSIVEKYLTTQAIGKISEQNIEVNPEQSGKRENSPTVIVIVDDNADDIFLTKRSVEKEGFVNRCIAVNDPDKLFIELDGFVENGVSPSDFLILLDIKMPRTNGFQLLNQIRSHPLYNQSAVVMLTASKAKPDREESKRMGCDGYLVKPFEGIEFISTIGNIPSIKKQLLQ